MNRCPRCQGVMLRGLDEQTCLNCGHSQAVPTPEPLRLPRRPVAA